MRIKNTLNKGINIANKRNFRRIRSLLKKKLARGAIINSDVLNYYNLANYTAPEKRITQSFYDESKLQKVKRWDKIIIPKNFCFIKDHEETVKFLNLFREKTSRKKAYNLEIIHINTQVIGLSASFYFDYYINKYINSWKKKGIAIIIKGTISNNKKVNNFLLSFGLLNLLGIKANETDSPWYDSDYSTKYYTFKAEGSNKEEYLSGKACTELVEYFNDCFQFNGHKIQKDAKEKLVKAFGEIIGNAEEHCGTNYNKWYVIGCYNKDDQYCSFAIINFGLSFYESFCKSNSLSAEVLEKISKVVQSNTSYIERIKTGTLSTVEHIYNLMALQDGISSKRTLTQQGSTRGQGLMDVIEFIDSIRSSEDLTEISIISGRSKILVDFEYPILYIPIGKNKEIRRQIIFNNAKDLHQPQDSNKLVLMSNKVYGTIITSSFKINKKYLEEIKY